MFIVALKKVVFEGESVLACLQHVYPSYQLTERSIAMHSQNMTRNGFTSITKDGITYRILPDKRRGDFK